MPPLSHIVASILLTLIVFIVLPALVSVVVEFFIPDYFADDETVRMWLEGIHFLLATACIIIGASLLVYMVGSLAFGW